MNEPTLLIKQMPGTLKEWLAEEAKANHRSMNKEAIRLLEEARAARETSKAPGRDNLAIDRIVKKLQILPVLDNRSVNEMLYDESGLPK